LKFHPRFSGNRDSGANLKKVLALVLAFACAFTMFAGAAFTDQADIKVDADVVDTLVSLGIIEGFEDGSFQPNATVTRAQMAKMIYVLRTGKSDASAYNDDKTSFTDIGSHWARGYIKYCQSLGIIAGKSNTIFAPNATVTAQEAAKMLLVTLGYDANKAGLVGANWASKTNALADENGLLEDVNTSFTGPCPRQYAAQLIYNAIDTPTVVWRDDAYTNTNYSDGDNKTIGEKYMGLHSVEGILTSFSKEDGKDTYGAKVTSITKQDGSKKVTLTDAKEEFTKIAKDYVALKNNKVKVLYKDTDEVYGVFALTDSNKVISGLLGDFGTSSDKLKLNGTKYTVADTNSVSVDGKTQQESKQNIGIVDYVDKKVDGLAKAYDASAISNTDNNKINLLDIKAFDVAQVTYVGKDYINVSYKTNTVSPAFDSKLKDDDAVWYDGIAKDDYVAVTAKANSSEDKVAVTKLDVVSGKITATKNAIDAKDYKVTIDGTTYEMAGVSTSAAADLTLNATVSIVVKGGYCLFVDDADAGSKDLALMTELYKTGNKWQATLLKADGSEETVTLKKSEAINGTNVDSMLSTLGYTADGFDGSVAGKGNLCKLVTYTKSGSEYKLKVLGASIDGKTYKGGYDVVTPSVASNIGDGLLSSGVILSYLSFLVITSGYTLIQDGVLGAVILQLVAADFVIVNNAVQNRAVVGREYTVNIVRSLEQNLNNTVGQSRVILSNLGERRNIVALVFVRVLLVSRGHGQGQLVGVLVGLLNNTVQSANRSLQTHVLLANSLVVSAGVGLVGVNAITKNNGRSKNGVVDQLCSVLTRASGSEGSVYVLQQASLISQCIGLGCPASAYQTSLVSIVTEGYEQHLSCFLSGYLVVRAELGVALTSDNAQGLAVLDVAACPVGANIGERGLVVVVRRSVRITGAQNVDHLRHLRTGYGAVGLERAIVVAVYYAQSNQSVHSLRSLDVGLIRERCTSKHGECASKRQYQCKNLFEMAYEKTNI